ncbi:MAG: hypothetical protein CMM10_15315 [Rhodospirillaceae bacterium]|nr:hypothetical protein [Rhodospirillaceae bacterium]MAF49626.1 hypothetical protein [Rhodospirillaceae bacterium]
MRQNEIFETYKDQVAFYLIYISEAHPADGWVTPQNLYDEIEYDQPTTEDERAEVAHVCQAALDVKMPMLIDSIDNDIDEKYIVWPTRYYVIGSDGLMAFNGAQGPRGLDPDAWEEAIKEQIAVKV